MPPESSAAWSDGLNEDDIDVMNADHSEAASVDQPRYSVSVTPDELRTIIHALVREKELPLRERLERRLHRIETLEIRRGR